MVEGKRELETTTDYFMLHTIQQAIKTSMHHNDTKTKRSQYMT